MSKSNNRGISLIDVIIAVAVMSILISPIIRQVITTVDTSSRAKEKQYVVEDAGKVMEYFRSNSMKELSETGYKGEDIVINSVSKSTASAKVWIYADYTDLKGADSLPTDPKTVSYNVTDYVLGSYDKSSATVLTYEVLGRENNKYTRTVSVDDLSANVQEKSARVVYELKNEGFEDVRDVLTSAGFTITSEGSAVKYDTNGHVSEIICVDSGNTNYLNPNSATPVITDIDSQKMAIIEGYASSIDNQFQNDFIANLMTIVARNKKTLESQPYGNGQTMYDYYLNKDNLNDAFDDARASNDFYRAVRLSVLSENIVDGKPSRYRVKCDVYYYASYTFLGESFGSVEDNKKYQYTVFNETFNTEEPPDVFFVYEPFVKKTDASYYSYASEENLYFQGDSYTSGYNDGYEPSKIYLIKADSSWAEEVVNKKNAQPYADGTDRSIAEDKKRNDDDSQKYYNYFYSRTAGSNWPVRISVRQIKDISDNNALPLQIITNISWRPNSTEDGGASYIGDNLIINNPVTIPGTSRKVRQFYTDNDIYVSLWSVNSWLKDTETIETYPSSSTDTMIGKITYPTSTGQAERYAIDVPTSDTVEYGRLYTMTVRYHTDDRDTEADTYLTGAKGAD